MAKKIYKISAKGKEILNVNMYIVSKKGTFKQKKQNFSQKICVIKNKVVSLHAKIKENG